MKSLNESQGDVTTKHLLQGVIVTDAKGTIRSVNDPATRLFGYNKREMLGQDIKMLMPPAVRQQHDAYMSAYLRTGKGAIVGSTRVVLGQRKDGRPVKLRLSLSFISGDHPMFCALLEELVEHNFTIRVDGEGKILSVEKGDPETVFGLPESVVVGSNVTIFMPPAVASRHDAMMKNYKGANHSSIIGRVRNLEARHADGHLFPIMLEVTEESAQPRVFRARVTEVEGSTEALINTNPEGIILSVSDTCKTLFGYTADEMVGQSVALIAPLAALTPGQRIVSVLHKDGSSFFLSVDIRSGKGPKGEPIFHGILKRSIAAKPARKTTATAEHIFSGDLLGWYEITKSLGSGYFGTVKMATHRLTQLNVAVKTLKKRQYSEAGMIYPPREIELIRKLNHPNICRLYDTITTEEAIFMITEVVPGGELFDYVAQKDHLSEDEARDILRQLVAATDYMHRSGIVHRDLKMENILMDTDGAVKIIDLGLGNFFDATGARLLNTFCGSVRKPVFFVLLVLKHVSRLTTLRPSSGRAKSTWVQRWTFGRWESCCL